ncbi:MAG: glycosyltransferase family 4 protein [Frankiales bacterium]|nr:glycosyltransferase family 4 protein [Frankiales bacterium]
MGQPAGGCLTTECGTRTGLRVAVYTDAVYSRRDGRVWADETFSLFAARLRPDVGRLLLVGRCADGHASGNRLPDDVELLALPHYPSLASPRALPPLFRSLRLLWRALDDVDAVWLLGPHPLATAFAVMADLRGRRVVLGVRQDLRAYVRDRRSGWARPAADLLERAWRGLARRHPVAVVGPELARQYSHAREAFLITVSLVEEHDLAPVRPMRREPRRLLSVGRLDPEKNPLLLADVLALLHARDPRWSLVICGDGPLEQQLRQRLAALGVAHVAELRGRLAHAELAQVYRDSDALLHVSWTEGFPQVLLEAFAARLPVVATAVGGVAELAAGIALLVPPGDAAAAASAVEKLDDLDLREAMVLAGTATARAHTGRAEREGLLALLAGA